MFEDLLHLFVLKNTIWILEHVWNFCWKFQLQGVANRGCSIRVGRDTEKQGKGMCYNISEE